MSHPLRLAALLAPDAGDGGGSTVTDSAATEEATSTVTGTDTKAAEGEAKQPAAETNAGATETKADDKVAALEKAAAALELKLPVGVDPKDPGVAAFRKLAAEQGLDSPKAQKLFEAHRAQLETATKAAIEKHQKDGAAWLDTQRKEWRASLQKDTEFGGEKYKATVEAVSRVFNKYGASDKELRAFLNDGAGDHPALVKFLARIGRDMAEDTATTKGKSGAAKPAGPNADLQKLFNKSPELFNA